MIECMAAGAELCVADVCFLFGEEAPGGGVHHRLVTVVGCKGTILGADVEVHSAGDDELPLKVDGGAEVLLVDLMAHRAGDAVLRGTLKLGCFLRELLEGKAREDFGVAVLVAVDQADGSHMAERAVILDELFRLGVVDGFATDAALPVGVA